MRQNQKLGETYGDHGRNIPRDRRMSRRSFHGKPVGALVARLTRPAFEKFGFPAAAIVTDWAAIVGPELASFTIPERLKWPKYRNDFNDKDYDSGPPRGATLLLRVDGPRAIEVQFMAGQILERISVYFGYKAVSELRIIQAPLPNQKTGAKDTRERKSSLEPIALPAIEKPGLRKALQRLSANILTANR